MADIKNLVDSKIAAKKVMVFSKSYCPYCTMAKKALEKYVVPGEEYEVMEIENLDKCQEIQDYLLSLTGARSVPRVFINQKFVGGGSEMKEMDGSGQLKELLSQ